MQLLDKRSDCNLPQLKECRVEFLSSCSLSCHRFFRLRLCFIVMFYFPFPNKTLLHLAKQAERQETTVGVDDEFFGGFFDSESKL